MPEFTTKILARRRMQFLSLWSANSSATDGKLTYSAMDGRKQLLQSNNLASSAQVLQLVVVEKVAIYMKHGESLKTNTSLLICTARAPMGLPW